MKLSISRGAAALLIAAAALTAACSNNDPTAPVAPSSVRTPAVRGPVRTTGDVGDATTPDNPNSGYVVAWGKDGGDQTGPDQPTSGYVVAWGKDGGDQPTGN